jgi:hypothetical protein
MGRNKDFSFVNELNVEEPLPVPENLVDAAEISDK